MDIASRKKPPLVEQTVRIPNIDVIGPRVLVQPYVSPGETSGGIIIPVRAQERQQRGIVLVAGEGFLTEKGEHIPCPVKPGQHIIYAKYGGAQIEIPDEHGGKQEYLIIMQSDIYCILFPELVGEEIAETELDT